MENFRMSQKKLDFPAITPLKSNYTSQNDFCSSQKQKYEIGFKQNQTSFIQNDNTLNNMKELYENHIPITVKSGEREDWSTYLVLKLSYIYGQKNHSTQTLHLELTDEDNNLFLYTMNLNETEFLTLKSEQCLLVDFQSFPSKLTELLELCINNQASKEDKVNFSCLFEIKSNGDAFLNIIENNQFKSLVHLALKFRSSTDDTLKTFLSNKLSKEKQENEDLRIKNQKLEEALAAKTSDLARYDNELKKFSFEKEKLIEQISLEEQKKINELKHLNLEKETKLLKESELDKKNLIEKYEKMVGEMQKKIENFTFSNNDLSENKLILESKERELSSKLALLTKENSFMEKDIENLKIESKKLESLKFSQEKTITEYTVKNEAMEKEIKNKEEIINKNKEILENAYRQRDISEQSLSEAKRTIDKLEAKLNKCSEEINKGNEFIRQLQEENSKKKEKIKLKNALIVQQEQTINQINENCEKYIKQINNCNKDIDNQQIRIKELENQVTEYKEKLIESQKIIESNNSMIQYLNRNLNETQKPASFNPSKSIAPKTYGRNYSNYSSNQIDEYRNENKNYLNMPNSATNFEENAFAVGNKSYLNNNNPYATNTFKAADYSTSKSPLRGTERSSIKEYLDSKYNFKNDKKDFDDAKEKSFTNNNRKNMPSSYNSSINNSETENKMITTIKPIKYIDPSSK